MDVQKKAKTLEKAIEAYEEKILNTIDTFRDVPLVVAVTKGDGNLVERPSIEFEAFRALVKDYYTAIKAYQEISGNQTVATTAKLEDLRSKFKVIA